MEANNMAAMREALDRIGNIAGFVAENCGDQQTAKYMNDIISEVQSAIATPPRNCDVGTLTEQQQRFHDFCEKMQHTDKACCGGCPIVLLRMKGVISNSCELAWAQMPYAAKEGGAE